LADLDVRHAAIRGGGGFDMLLTSMVLSVIVSGTGAPNPPAAFTPPGATDPAALARYTAAADYSKEKAGRAMLVMVRGKVVFERADNGWSLERPHPLASGTKSFVGVMAAAAVQDGLLSWDELACDTLIEWKSDDLKSKITARHLLSLSSGLEPNDAQLSRKGAGAGMLGDRRTAMD
jgi:CubicO group peptidase (beta-lactamase class C family)